MSRQGLAGRAMRSPLNPMWVLGQGPRNAGQMGMDMMPTMAKLGDAAVDSVAPALSGLASTAASTVMPMVTKGLTDLGAGALATIPGIGPALGGALELGGTAAAAATPLITQLAGAAAPMAAKGMGRMAYAGGMQGMRGVGDAMSGGPDNPETQKTNDFRSITMSTPDLRGAPNPMDLLKGGGGAQGFTPYEPPPQLPQGEPPMDHSGHNHGRPPAELRHQSPQGSQEDFGPSEPPVTPMRRDQQAAVDIGPLGKTPGSAMSLLGDQEDATVRAIQATEKKRPEYPEGGSGSFINGGPADTYPSINLPRQTVSSSLTGRPTPGAEGGGGGLLNNPQDDVLSILRRRSHNL